MVDKDIHQHIDGDASDRVAEKAAEINARLAARPDQDAASLALTPPPKASKVAKEK
jgi:hypothetical protein